MQGFKTPFPTSISLIGTAQLLYQVQQTHFFLYNFLVPEIFSINGWREMKGEGRRTQTCEYNNSEKECIRLDILIRPCYG
jgi:hypothetical protein